MNDTRRSNSSINFLDDENLSMASYSSKLYQNLDSISQIGENIAAEGGEGLDLGKVNEELSKRNDKIKELHTMNVKLKGLLKKAKQVIDQN